MQTMKMVFNQDTDDNSNQCSLIKYQVCGGKSEGQSGKPDRVNLSEIFHKSCLNSFKEGPCGKGV